MSAPLPAGSSKAQAQAQAWEHAATHEHAPDNSDHCKNTSPKLYIVSTQGGTLPCLLLIHNSALSATNT
jgi:hypothetical protein